MPVFSPMRVAQSGHFGRESDNLVREDDLERQVGAAIVIFVFA